MSCVVEVNDETRFNKLRVHFGSEGNADKLTLKGFALLPKGDVDVLIGRVTDFAIKVELLDIIARYKLASNVSRKY